MSENSNQPGEYDAVLGGQAPLTADSAVLGGLAGVKQCLARGGVEQRIDALLDAFEYGQEGLELVIQALEDTSSEVCSAAYSLLQDSTEPKAKQALWEYNPYKHFKLLHILEGHREYLSCLAISPDGKILVNGCRDIVKVWDLQSGQLIHTFNLYRPLGPFSMSLARTSRLLSAIMRSRLKYGICGLNRKFAHSTWMWIRLAPSPLPLMDKPLFVAVAVVGVVGTTTLTCLLKCGYIQES